MAPIDHRLGLVGRSLRSRRLVDVRTITSIGELRHFTDEQRRHGRTVGFVPTMGYLHDGHLSLIGRAASRCDIVVTSLFVNPLQFAAGEDLGTYPRDPEGDADKANRAGSDVLFVPDETEMYPDGRDHVLTSVAVPDLASVMEGSSRPTHFAGVCTVVAKLFNIVGECSAFFGEKDFQQLAIIRAMVRDLSAPVDVIGCPTVREADGLAMSSRNVRLDESERRAAPVLNRALRGGAAAIMDGETDRSAVLATMADVIASEPLARLDYLEIADPDSLRPSDPVGRTARIFGAVQFSRARLIDNIAVDQSGDGSRS